MGASTVLGALRARLERSESWRHVRTRFFMIKRLVLVCFLLGLDVRDLVYKAVWQGPAQSFSFETGSVSYLETKPIESLVTPDMRRHGDVSSGWPSFLSVCDDLYPFVSAGSTFFLSAKLTGCRVISNGTSVTTPPLIVTSSVRVDSMAWAACRLLYHARRPHLCGDRMVVKFNERYAFDEVTVAAAAMAPIGSFAEDELLRLLDLIGGSYPIQSVICVEGFPLHSETDRGVFTPNLFACASPNVDRVEFVGFDAHSFKLLQGPMTWLTVDTLAFLNWRYGIRQNCASDYLIADATIADEGASVVDDEAASLQRATISIRAITATNFSSHGLLYGLVILLDVLLLTSHLVSIAELLKWMQLAQYYRLQVWIHHFDDANVDRVTSAPVLPGQLVPEKKWRKKSKTPRPSANQIDLGQFTDTQGRFDERALYAFFSTSVYRGWRYRTMIVATRMLSWLIIMPNSVIWTWSESKNMKFQAYLGSIKSWVLVAATFTWSWRAFVRFNEPLAYYVSRRTHVTNQEVIALASVVAFWQRDHIFSICEQKWQLERQRTNDLTSFRGGYLAHGNAYEPRLEHTTTTPLRIAWIIYAPLMRIVVGSVLMIWLWLAVKLVASTLWRRAFGATQDKAAAVPEEPYRRLALELALDSPIRALSIVRYQFSMEMVKNGERYIRPSCYLDYGIMLKTVEYKRIVHLSDIFKQKVPIPGGSKK